MPLFQLDVQKVQSGEYWTNRYIVDCADLSAAVSQSTLVVAAEREFHGTAVGFDKCRVAPYPVTGGSYIIVPLSGTGDYAGSGSQLALFNVARVDLQVGVGRPSRKYYRCPIFEADQIDGALTIAFRGLIDTTLNALIDDMDTLVDVDGQPITSAVTATSVGMRQLRRGSKRRVTPVI